MLDRQKYLFIVNPVAGGEDKSELLEAIAHKNWHKSPTFFETTPTTKWLEIEQIISKEKFDVVVAIGGDGTVRLVAEALQHQNIPMGIIPMGSGNGLAKDLGISLMPLDALEVVLHGKPCPLDALSVNGHFCVHIGDAGLNASIVQDYALGNFRTMGAYAWHLLRYYFSFEPNNITLKMSGLISYEGEALLVAFCNGKQYGSDLIINPKGILNDGEFEVIVLKPFFKAVGPALFLELMNGELDPEYFLTFKGKSCEISMTQPWPWQLDGEFMGQSTSLNVTVLNNRVHYLK
jgi:diacylglycerol kinase family enzyme